jgi:hypothetical protein
MQHFQNARVTGGVTQLTSMVVRYGGSLTLYPDTAVVPAAKGVIRKKKCRSFRPFIQSADCLTF